MEQREQHYYTYEEFKKYAENHRCEWIDGVIYDMAGTHANHGTIIIRLSKALGIYLDDKPCRVYPETVDLEFFEGEERLMTLQPDLKVVCGQDRTRDGIIIKTPILIVEVLSPSTSSFDCIAKRNIYRHNGVQEYWIVSWEEHAVTVSTLTDTDYDDERYTTGTVHSKVLPGFSIDLTALFSDLDDA